MNRLLLTTLFLLTSVFLYSQNKVSKEEQQRMITMIEKKASTIKTLHCDFKQEKTLKMLNHKLTSSGIMDYAQPGKLRWKYSKPYSYNFIINGNKVLVKNNHHTNTIDARQSKIFKEITQIMVNSVTGRCLSNKKDFKIEMFLSADQWIANLSPLQKEMKSMFKSIKLYINPQKCIVTKVELCENNNDVTKIQMINYKINVPISEKTFSLN